MGAINLSYAVLVHRYTHGPPPAEANPWDSWPFNSEHFRELSGVTEGFGLSRPPIGLARENIKAAKLKAWEQHGKRAEEFLNRCDAEWREAAKKPSIATFQKHVLTRMHGHLDWEWAVRETFMLPSAGLSAKVQELMCDLSCDAASAYRDAREDAVGIFNYSNALLLLTYHLQTH
jgi:hypothetical protein